MIEDSADPHRGQRGRHHDRHRSAGHFELEFDGIRTIIAIPDQYGAVQRVGEHLGKAVAADLVVWLPDASMGNGSRQFSDSEACAALHRDIMSADLAILGSGSIGTNVSAHEIAADTGRPVLVVPMETARMPGSRVAVQWCGTRETASALRDALPLLRDAETIVVFDALSHTKLNCRPSDAVKYLERHGFEAYEVDLDLNAGSVVEQRIDLIVGLPPPAFFSGQTPEHTAMSLGVPTLISA